MRRDAVLPSGRVRRLRDVDARRALLVTWRGSGYRTRLAQGETMANEGNQHTADAAAPSAQVPEPPFAERARTLVHLGRTGTLATHSRRVGGYPFGSVAPYGLDAEGCPSFLISTMAMHTQNLLADPRASLLVLQPGWSEDPLAGGRVTLVGDVRRVGDADLAAVRADYLARQENAQHWVDFDDFAFYRLEVRDLYYVAGFGAMGWVEADAYRAAAPDPLADHAQGILEHMNADHGDALRLYCKVFADVAADEATMTSVDRMGFRVRARSGDRLRGLRINFPREAHTSGEARIVLVEMVREARARAGATS
jgi:putative heme iron utilization protein